MASCLESAKALEASYSLSSENSVQISRSRREFWAAISTVFSGKFIHDKMISNGTNTRVLASAGLEVTDPAGWLGHSTSFQQPVRVISLGFSFILHLLSFLLYCNSSLSLSLSSDRINRDRIVVRPRDNI